MNSSRSNNNDNNKHNKNSGFNNNDHTDIYNNPNKANVQKDYNNDMVYDSC